MKRITLILWSIFVLLIPHILHAQTISTDLSIESIPNNPSPGQSVTLTAQSFGVDLSTATLVWTYNNTVVARGVGETTIAIAAPVAGSAGVISVSVSAVGIEPATATLVLRPASTDLLWEALDAYTPPFYKGKALLPLEGQVKVTAIPLATAPSVLNYQWSRNNSAVASASGSNKSSIVFIQDPLNGQEKIDVTLGSGSYTSTATIRMNPYNPLLIAYTNKEGYVDYARGYENTIALTTNGIVLRFEPYFFSVPNSIAYNLSFDTELDGTRISPAQQNEIGISRPETPGRSILKFDISTIAYTLQNLQKSFTLAFN